MNPDEAAENLGSADAPPPARGSKSEPGDWQPDLNPTQAEAFHDASETVFIEGEKGSGKSIGAGDIIVRHAYENDNALIQIITSSIRTGAEGIWHDLETLVLPRWRDGNKYPPFILQADGTLIDHPKAGEYMDHGIGLEYTPGKLDPLTKDRHRWIRNMHGGWSKLLLISIPHASMVEDRMKGPAPSMIYVDELTNCGEKRGPVGMEYYTFPSAQLGRRRDITGPQQFIATMNPKGPTHWAYKLKEDHKDDPAFKCYHIPITENLHRLPRGYVERLKKLFASNPVEYDRLIKGLWIDAPDGEALFSDYFIPALHVRGGKVGLSPVKGFPIIISYDLGQIWNCATFMQLVPLKDGRLIWLVFDEVDHLGERILYKNMAKECVARIEYWNRRVGCDFAVMQYAGDDSTSQHRAGTGTYDATEFEKEFNAARNHGRKHKIIGTPRGAGSIAARVRLVQSKLAQEEMFISTKCVNRIAMFNLLECNPDNPMEPKAKSKHGHPFDSLSAGPFMVELKGVARLNQTPSTPSLLSCGVR